MTNQASEYLPARQQPRGPHQYNKVFELVPAQDDTQQILQQRWDVLTDKNLPKGAKLLFVMVLELALNPRVYDMRGVVTISVQKLCEFMDSCENSIGRWKRALVSRGVFWITKHFMPNCWPMHTFHISVIVPNSKDLKFTTLDGLWGNGARRPEVPPGEGARALRRNSCGRPPGGQAVVKPSISLENEGGGGEKVGLSVAIVACGNGNNRIGQSQPLPRGVAKSATGSGNYVGRRVAKTGGGQSQKTAVIKESQIPDKEVGETSLSCLTAEERAAATSNQQFSGSSALRKENGENGFLKELARTLAKYDPKKAEKEMVNWGGRWRNRYRENRSKALRVLAELGVMVKERKITSNAGAAADDLWRRFV